MRAITDVREITLRLSTCASCPTMSELVAGGWFESVRTETWSWAVDLSTDQVRRLFTTFSSWTAAEADAAAQAADDLGGRVTEQYRSVLHLLRSREPE